MIILLVHKCESKGLGVIDVSGFFPQKSWIQDIKRCELKIEGAQGSKP